MDEETKRQFKKKVYFALCVCVLLSWYFAGMLHTTFSGYGHTWSPFAIASCMFQYGFPTKWFIFFAAVFGILIVAFVINVIRTNEGMDVMGRRFKMSTDRQSYGQAHFETPDEYETKATIESPDTAVGTIMGQLDQSGKRVITQRMDAKNRGNRHIAVLGSSGSGKTYTFVKTSCYQVVRRRESIIITDPDGGLFRDMSGYFADNGYIVRHLDLNDIRRSDGWDCLRAVSPETAELDAQMFAQTIIANVVDDPTSIYATGPMALLKAIILYVVLDPNRPPEEKNIGEVYKCLQNEEGEAYLDRIFDPQGMPEVMKPCVPPYLSFKQGSPNLRGNLITNLSVQLQLFQNDMVCKLLSTDDIDLVLPGQQPCAYFCGFPDSHDTYRFIVSLFFSMIFIKLIHYSDVVLHKPLPIPVNFLLDEFPSIGCLPDWDKKMATIRKRSMNVTMIFQDIMQFQNVYERSWGTILGNCATLLILGINEDQSSELVTKRIGDTTIEAKTEQHAATETFLTAFNKNSTGEGRRALLSYDELYKIHEDNAIILFQGHNPILCWKFPHVLHPESKKLREVAYDAIPDIEDTEGRRKMREAEQDFVSEYLRKHPLSEVDRSYTNIYEPKRKKSISEKVQGSVRKGLLSIAEIIDEKEGADYEAAAKVVSTPVSVVEEEDQATREASCPISLDEGDFEYLALEDVFGLPGAVAVESGFSLGVEGGAETDIDSDASSDVGTDIGVEDRCDAEPKAQIEYEDGAITGAETGGLEWSSPQAEPELVSHTVGNETVQNPVEEKENSASAVEDTTPKHGAENGPETGCAESVAEVEDNATEAKGAAGVAVTAKVAEFDSDLAFDCGLMTRVEPDYKPKEKIDLESDAASAQKRKVPAAPFQTEPTQKNGGSGDVERIRASNAKKTERMMKENSKSDVSFLPKVTVSSQKKGGDAAAQPKPYRPGKKDHSNELEENA